MLYQKIFATLIVGSLEALVKNVPVTTTGTAITALAENGNIASGVVADEKAMFSFHGTDKFLVVGNEAAKQLVLALDYATMGALIPELQAEKLVDDVTGLVTEKQAGKAEDYVVAVVKLSKKATAKNVSDLVTTIATAISAPAPTPKPAPVPAPAPTPAPTPAPMKKQRNF